MTTLHKDLGLERFLTGPTEEELYRRLRALQKIASPLLTVCLSEDRKKVLWKIKGTGEVRLIDPVEILWT